MMLAIVIITLYAFMIELIGVEIGLLFATMFLIGTITTMKIIKMTGFDKKLDEFLERDN